MKSSKTLAIVAAASLLLGACVKKNAGADEVEEGKTYTLTKKAYNHIAEVMKHVEKERYKEALHELGNMRERDFLNPYEKGRMWLMYSQVYFQTKEHDKALKAMRNAYELRKAMPEQEALDTEYNLAQLYLMTEDYEKSAELFTRWLKKSKNAQPQVYYMTASAFAQAKDYKKALGYAEKALKQAGEEPQEPWLVLALSVNYELKRNERVAELLKQLINMYPKKQYWLQLSQTYLALDQGAKALATLELAYAQKLLEEESELLTLAQLQMQERVPIKAAVLLEKHMKDKSLERSPKSLELLAKAYILAHERKKAERILNYAAKRAETGELYLHLGRILLEDQQFAKAKKAIERALKKGKLPSEGQAHLLIGIIHFNAGKRGPALAAFARAAKDKQAEADAKRWIGVVKGDPTLGGEAGGEASGEQAEQAEQADKSDGADKGNAKEPEQKDAKGSRKQTKRKPAA